MRSCSVFLAACFSFSTAAVMAQSRPGPAYFLRQAAREPHAGLVLLPGGRVPALSTVAPLPTVRAAAANVALPPATQPSRPLATEEPAPRHDLTGNGAYSPYDPYQNLPESFRKYTLPPPEPVLLQLIRSAVRQ